MRELLEVVLREEGHRTATAPDGVTALDLVARGGVPPDLILADFNLPNGMNGLQATAKMQRNLHREIPVIILTGDISTSTLRDIASQDCVQLNKPVKTADCHAGDPASAADLAICRMCRLPRQCRMRQAPSRTRLFSSLMTTVTVARQFAACWRQQAILVEDFATCEAFLEA